MSDPVLSYKTVKAVVPSILLTFAHKEILRQGSPEVVIAMLATLRRRVRLIGVGCLVMAIIQLARSVMAGIQVSDSFTWLRLMDGAISILAAIVFVFLFIHRQRETRALDALTGRVTEAETIN